MRPDHSRILVSLSLLVSISWTGCTSNAHAHSKTESAASESGGTKVISDSYEIQKEETAAQIKESLPEDDAKSKVPNSGQVFVGKKKMEAVQDSSRIELQDASTAVKLLPRKADGTPTIALALGGGGARGAAHIGVIRVLEREGIHIDEIIGNSMGAIVGGMYSAGVSLDDLTTHFTDKSLSKAYLPGGFAKKIALLPLSHVLHPFRKKHYAGLWSGEKLTKYLNSVLPRPEMQMSDTKIPFSSVGTNLLDGKAYRITEGSLPTAIKASCAISPVIQPVALGDKLFMDGGIRANLPASAARDSGAGFVIAVLVDEPLRELPPKQFTKVKNIASRMSDIVFAVADERQMQFADIVINPDVSKIDVFANTPEQVLAAIHAGELAAEKAMPALKAKLKKSDSTSQAANLSLQK